MKSLLATVGLALALIGSTGQCGVIESFNEGLEPNYGAPWYAREVGWLYSPSSSYTLTEITTRFAYEGSRTITLAVYSAPPLDGGVLLRSANFTPLANAYSGSEIDPLEVKKGSSYFVAFINVRDVGVNVTYEPNQQTLGPGLYYGFTGSLEKAIFDTGPQVSVHGQPIIRFVGKEAEVPEPTTLSLFAAAALGLACLRRKQYAAKV